MPKSAITPSPVNLYLAEIEAFSQAILDDVDTSDSALAGLRSQMILAACYKSARSGREMDRMGHRELPPRSRPAIRRQQHRCDKSQAAPGRSRLGRGRHRTRPQAVGRPRRPVSALSPVHLRVAGIPSRPRVAAFGGGYPIKIDGHIVGAIGVSGGTVGATREAARPQRGQPAVAGWRPHA